MEKIKSLSGKGKVFSGDHLLGEAPYRIDVYQEFIEGRTLDGGYRVPGLKRVIGSVRGTFPIGELLRLVTAEGHTLNFFVTDGAGNIQASGPFLTFDGKPVV